MREIIQDIRDWEGDDLPFVLATVIRTWGSAPRPMGSHMAISVTGDIVGSVSGGCVENAVAEAAEQVLKTGIPEMLRFGVSDETAWSVGLACGGSIEVFLQRMLPEENIFRSIRQTIETRQAGIWCTHIRGREELLGRSLFMTAESTTGNIDYGPIDAALRSSLDASSPPRLPRVFAIGEDEIFIEPILPPARLIIVGGVHIAVPLSKMAPELDFEVYIIDPRKRFATKKRFPHVRHLIRKWPDEALETLGIDPNTFIVVLAHDEKLDDPALTTALRAKPAYIGVLGSQRTHEKRLDRLREAGIAEEDLRRLHAPVGLSIGAKSPAEIAVSILAEMVAVRRGSDEAKAD